MLGHGLVLVESWYLYVRTCVYVNLKVKVKFAVNVEKTCACADRIRWDDDSGGALGLGLIRDLLHGSVACWCPVSFDLST